MFLQARSRDPPRSVFRIGLYERVKEHPCALDVTNFSVSFEDYAVEGGQVAFGVDGRCGARVSGGTGYLGGVG
jgi:hypothetical protein